MARSTFAAAILLVALLLSGRASGNAGLRFFYDRGKQGGAFLDRQTHLVVEHEDLAFRCTVGTCDFEAVYHVLNPGDSREEAIGAFYGIEADRITAAADGVDVRRELTPEQRRAVDAAVEHFDPQGTVSASAPPPIRQGFALGVDARARVTLVFSGRMRPAGHDDGHLSREFAIPGLEARHGWLGTPAREDASDHYAYVLSPIRSWAGSPTIDVTVRCPGAGCWEPGQEGWTVGSGEGGFAARRTIASRDAGMLTFRLVGTPGNHLVHGGPLAGVGGGEGGARARVGYEAGFDEVVIASASVETNFHGVTTLVPLAELATPEIIFIIPSLGLGAGVPVQLRSGAATQVGVRGQLTVSYPVISLVFPVDVFPGASSDVWQAALLVQASF